jgi:hypothetical protein
VAISVSLKLGPFFREGVPPNEKVLVNLGVWVCISEGRQNAKKGSYVAVFLLVATIVCGGRVIFTVTSGVSAL